MNCEQSQQLLIEYIEGSLHAEATIELEKHLRSCPECQLEYKELQTTIAQVSEVPAPQPDEKFWEAFPDQVLDAYKKQEQTAPEYVATDSVRTENSLLQTLQDWLLPNRWPQLAMQTIMLTIAIGGIVFWSFQPASIQFDSAKLQAQLGSQQNLATAIKQHITIVADNNSYGFGNQPAQADFFKTGMIYSESLALLAGNDINALQQHLLLLGNELSNMPVNQRLNEINATISKGATEQTSLLKAIAELQPELEKQAANQSEKDRLLFQLGSWLNDIKLAAAVKNPRVLRQSHTAEYLLDAMQAQNLPKGTIAKLKQILVIMQSSSLADEDYAMVLQHINVIQQIMG